MALLMDMRNKRVAETDAEEAMQHIMRREEFCVHCGKRFRTVGEINRLEEDGEIAVCADCKKKFENEFNKHFLIWLKEFKKDFIRHTRR